MAGVYRALKPGGRFVAEMGGAGNIATLHDTLTQAAVAHGHRLQTVWFFPTAAEYRALLQQAGFEVVRLISFARPTPLPTGIEGWLATFAAPLLVKIPPARQAVILQQAATQLRATLPQENAGCVADYVRLRFEVHKA